MIVRKNTEGISHKCDMVVPKHVKTIMLENTV
jgi:hypothetical protein